METQGRSSCSKMTKKGQDTGCRMLSQAYNCSDLGSWSLPSEAETILQGSWSYEQDTGQSHVYLARCYFLL